MGMGPKQQSMQAIWEQPDAELVCLLCGAVVGETYGNRARHPASCERPLPWVGGRPRCCQCGGTLVCEPAADIWGTGPKPADL